MRKKPISLLMMWGENIGCEMQGPGLLSMRWELGEPQNSMSS